MRSNITSCELNRSVLLRRGSRAEHSVATPVGEFNARPGNLLEVAFVADQQSPDAMGDATLMLAAIERGDPKAADQLLTLVYDELRRLANFKLAQESPGQTLQPTALVHEAWIRLVGDRSPSFNGRAHFFRAAGEAMRRILIDRARRKHTEKHGGTYEHVNIEGLELAAPGEEAHLLAVHEALDKLAMEHPVQAELVKLRYFLGMTNEEIAQILEISVSTAKNYWNFSRAWLMHEMEGE